MTHKLTPICMALCLLVLEACATLSPAQTTPTSPPATEPAVATLATVWFPPTSTATARPPLTPSPTEETRPGLGQAITTDTFENPALWSVRESDSSSVIVANGRITLAISQPRLYLFSLRSEPLLTNFYAEINATTSLCQGPDEFGLLFRAQGTSDYYRLVLACDRTVRLERVQGGAIALLQQRLPSGDVPPGSPGQVRIGVWAVGSELRFFLNGHFQFGLNDPVYKFGTLGVFARSGGENAVTITFSDLTIQDVTYLSPTPSPTPSKTPTPTRTPSVTP